jgi:IclR family pca regulon transcriptional regulator
MSTITPDSPDYVASLARGVAVIKAFGRQSRRLTLSEVAASSGLSRAAARRFLLTLCALGYARGDGKHFELTPRLLEIGYAYLASLEFWELIQPALEEIARQLNESSSAAVLDGDEVVYVARSASRQRLIAVALTVGTRLPAHATSMGQVLLARLPPDELERYFKAARPARFTAKTRVSRREIEARLEEVRRQGHALADQELEEGLRSIAVPLRDRAGRTVAAINVSAHAARVPAKTLTQEYLPVLKQGAAAIERLLGTR